MFTNISSGLWPHLVENPSGFFNSHDTEKDFKKNLKNLGPNWHYSSTEIYYDNNSLGYRAKELEYYKNKEFVLVMGCSHTEGIGQAENEIWHYQIKKEFGFEILNAGFGGTGPDIQMLNSFLFLNNSNLIPKAVVIQWPNFSRFTFKGENLIRPLLPNLKMKFVQPDSNSFFNNFLNQQSFLQSFYKWWLYDNNDINNSQIFMECTRLMWNLADIPYYDFTIDSDKITDLDNLLFTVSSRDIARDQQHHGPLFNEELGKNVCEKLRNFYDIR